MEDVRIRLTPSPPRPLPASPRPQSPLPLLLDEFPPVRLPKLRPAVEFTEMLKSATLESQFDPEELADLLDPREHVSTPLDDPGLKLSLRNYIALMGSSQEAYEAVRQNTRDCFPDIELLLHWQAE